MGSNASAAAALRLSGGKRTTTGKPAGAVEQFGDHAAGDRSFDEFLDIPHVEPIAGEGFPVEPDFELRRYGKHLHLAGGGAPDRLDDPQHLYPQVLEDGGVGPEDLHRHVRLDPGNDFVEAHRHRLGEVHREAGNFRERCRHRIDQLLLRTPAVPVVVGMKQHVHVTLIDAHGLGGEIRPAHLGNDLRHFVELGEQLRSTRVEISTDSSSETDGSFRVSTRIEPSSSRGMNSVPRKEWIRRRSG